MLAAVVVAIPRFDYKSLSWLVDSETSDQAGGVTPAPTIRRSLASLFSRAAFPPPSPPLSSSSLSPAVLFLRPPPSLLRPPTNPAFPLARPLTSGARPGARPATPEAREREGQGGRGREGEGGRREGGRQAVRARGGVIFCVDFFAPWRKLFFYPSPPYSFLNGF